MTFESEIFLPAAARFGSDREWTPSERRELRAQARMLRDRMRLVMENQERLQGSAQALVEYLSQ